MAIESEVTYTCLAAHEIEASALEAKTEIRRLDAGAEVRLCRQHGTPIATSLPPRSGQRQDTDNTK